ncbi:MAG: hypothetical protein SangKO_044720 [Sandaracinaceae bacterium]
MAGGASKLPALPFGAKIPGTKTVLTRSRDAVIIGSMAVEAAEETASEPDVEAEQFVAVSVFVVANDKAEDVHGAFLARPHLVDEAPGFVRMEVLRGLDDPKEFWLVTHWRDEASYAAWHHGHTYHASHAGIPRGLKLVRGSAQVRRMRSIAR